MLSKKEARRNAIDEIRNGEHVATIEIQGFAEACGYGSLDDFWDQDGDSIVARYQDNFWYDGYPAVRVAFAQGTDPSLVARMLRKMAGMLESSSAQQIANLGLIRDHTDYARRMGDGIVSIGNIRQDVQDHLRDAEEGDEGLGQ